MPSSERRCCRASRGGNLAGPIIPISSRHLPCPCSPRTSITETWHSACSTERTLHEQCGSSRSFLMGGAAFPIECGPLHTPHGQGTTSTSLIYQTWVSQ